MHAWLLTCWILAHAGDITTSHLALTQPGFSEANPLLPSNATANLAMLSAETAGGAYSLHRWHRDHPKLTTLFLVAGIGFETAQTMKNIHTLHSR